MKIECVCMLPRRQDSGNERERACLSVKEREIERETWRESTQRFGWQWVLISVRSAPPSQTNQIEKNSTEVNFFGYQGHPGTMTPKTWISGVIILFLSLSTSNEAQRFEGKKEQHLDCQAKHMAALQWAVLPNICSKKSVVFIWKDRHDKERGSRVTIYHRYL